jgi:pre-mRNA-splicing factor 38A
MVNQTNETGISFHGVDPQNLIDYIVRKKIYESIYWKEHCFGLSAQTVIDNAVELDSVGVTTGGCCRPTNFICLILKMLQIRTEKDVVLEFLKNEDYKYVRILGAFYLRLVGNETEIYQYLGPLLHDYRKIRVHTIHGTFKLSHVDEIIDDLLIRSTVFSITLPRIRPRSNFIKSSELDSEKHQILHDE